MSVEINWLLLTDLHLGLDKDNWLWPKIKHDLCKDIKKLEDKIGNFDLVFFTGDFVQQGSMEDFDELNVELKNLWKTFSNEPLLCPVPGNKLSMDFLRLHQMCLQLLLQIGYFSGL